MKLKKGDMVKILAGKDRGKTGQISHVYTGENRVMVEGLNLYKKRVRPKQSGKKGEIVSVPRPISSSNTMIICRNCKQPMRTGYRVESNQKVRYCKKCQSET